MLFAFGEVDGFEEGVFYSMERCLAWVLCGVLVFWVVVV